MMGMTMLALGVALFGGFLGWLLARHKPETRGWGAGWVCAVLGMLAGYWIYASDQQMRRETLFEVMAQGSEGVQVGQPAPLRQLEFNVKHPGVGHTLMVSPSSYKVAAPAGDVEISFRLLDPQGRELLQDQRTYEVRAGGRGRKGDWQAAYFPFTPEQAGPHTLELVLLTVGIPQVHVRVVDPENTDGERIPGF
jgi:hypothetical protein